MDVVEIFDVEVHEPARYQESMTAVKPALAVFGASYPARGGALSVHEGDRRPQRLVILEFPLFSAWERFYRGPMYQSLKAIRDACSSARLVNFERLPA